jgi:hypothetical protein
LVAVFLAGCGAASTPTAAAQRTSLPTPTPQPTMAPTAVAKTVGETIDLLYCAEAPKSDWCKTLVKQDGAYTIEVKDDLVNIRMDLRLNKKGKAAAMVACQNIAVAHFDENGQPLPVKEYWVLDKTGVGGHE